VLIPRGAPLFSDAFVRDLFLLVCTVTVGAVSAVGSQQLLLHVASPRLAYNVSLALATSCSSAAHARLVHRRPIRSVLPGIAAGAPVAYAAMRMVHFLLGA
jgi:hypothetical protein